MLTLLLYNILMNTRMFVLNILHLKTTTFVLLQCLTDSDVWGSCFCRLCCLRLLLLSTLTFDHSYVWPVLRLITPTFDNSYVWSLLRLTSPTFDQSYVWSLLRLTTPTFDHSYVWPVLRLTTPTFDFSYIWSLLRLTTPTFVVGPCIALSFNPTEL